jgi:hypothetical protein
MYEIASLFGIASKLHMRPFILQQFARQVKLLQKDFSSLRPLLLHYFPTKAVKFGSKCCSYDDVERLRKYTGENVTMKGFHFQSYRYFDEIRQQIKEIFAFSSDAVNAAQSLIENVRKEFRSRVENQTSTMAKVIPLCVHIRRGDFVNNTELLESTGDFTISVSQVHGWFFGK